MSGVASNPKPRNCYQYRGEDKYDSDDNSHYGASLLVIYACRSQPGTSSIRQTLGGS